jgi:hypothetical protein
MRLQQKRTNFASGFNEFNARSLRHHFGFVLSAKVRQNSTADVNTFADVKGQAAITLEQVNP